MELPRRTQGNPDGGLWAADEAHFVQRPEGGGGGVGGGSAEGRGVRGVG